jgi:FKBP-type peptidyl-prolyl cis-trans isomerase FklB
MYRRSILAAALGGCLTLFGVSAFGQGFPSHPTSCAAPKSRRKNRRRTTPNAKAKTMTTPAVSRDPAENLKIGTDFLAAHKNERGVITTASGLQYAVTTSGPATGERPSAASVVEVNYEGKLLNGQVFDSSYSRGQAAQFPVNALIAGWVEVLQLMRPGDEWTIWIPANLAYGERGASGLIPPNSVLIFRMKLEKIVA